MKFLVNSGTKEEPILSIKDLENLQIIYNNYTNLYDIKGIVKYGFDEDIYEKLYSYSSIDLCNKFILYAIIQFENSSTDIIYVPTEEELNNIHVEFSYRIGKKALRPFIFRSS